MRYVIEDECWAADRSTNQASRESARVGLSVYIHNSRTQYRLVYSSSAAVYGRPECLPIVEDHPMNPESPYGRSKLISEHILSDVS